jgi:hypothetical protein
VLHHQPKEATGTPPLQYFAAKISFLFAFPFTASLSLLQSLVEISCLMNSLKTNETIRELELSGNSISVGGGKEIAAMLRGKNEEELQQGFTLLSSLGM